MKLYITKSAAATKNAVVLDDMILTKDMPTSAGSKMLDGYMSLFEAEVVTRLKDAGYDICGKANVGEIGIDLLGETSYYGACIDNDEIKNASAELVKSGEVEFAINLDVNGAPRRAAALADLVYIKPTYGTVSRFGTIPAVCSGETVGVMAKTADKCKEALSKIAGHDDKDGTSLKDEDCKRVNVKSTDIKKVAVFKTDDISDEVKANLDEKLELLKVSGVEVIELDTRILEKAQVAWNILMSAEVCNNVSKYDGIKYGYRTKNFSNIDELYTNSRSESFGYLLKSTILFGSETLSDDNYMKVYDKALRVRRVICEFMEKAFKDVDAIISPVCKKMAYTVSDIEKGTYIAYDESKFTAVASITGLPSVVAGGVELIGDAFTDASLLETAKVLTKEGK